MTCNNIILSQPNAGEISTHEIPSDVSARLNFSPDAIEALQLSDTGELVISFVDGGQLKLSNFDQLIDNGNLLYLEDGTLIDPSILTVAATSPQALSKIETAAGAASASDAISIQQPAANTVEEITAQAGQKYVCEFDPSTANVEIIDGKMVMTFADGSQVVINNYSEAVAGELPAELTLTDGTVVEPEELLTEVTEVEEIEEILEVAEAPVEEEVVAEQVAAVEPAAGEESVAEQLAQIEPAAGETGGATGNSGYGFNSSPTEIDLNAPDAIGPLGPTALRYGIELPQQEQLLIQPAAGPIDDRPFFTPSSVTLDETNLVTNNSGVSTPLVANGTVNVDYGNDGPGTLELTGNVTATCEVAGGVLSSAGVPVIISFDSATNTYTGVAGTATVFTMVVDLQTGDYTYTQTEPFDHALTTNDNEPICLNFEIIAEDADGDRTLSNIRVNVLDDAPLVTSQIAVAVDETNFTSGALTASGQFFTDPGEDVVATFPGNDTFQFSGSVNNGALTSNGVPVVVTFDANTNTYTGVAGTTTVFAVVIDPTDGSYDYTQFEPLDHADDTDSNDFLTLEFGVNVVDFDGDTKSGFIAVNVFDDGPRIEDQYNTVDETDLGPVVVNGTVDYDFGNDGPAPTDAFVANGDFDSSGSRLNNALTHNGTPVLVTFDSATGTYTGMAGSVVVFTMQIDSNGDYSFELLNTLDHADPNDPNDIIHLEFGVSVTDYDGDTAEGTIIIDVKDDVPVIGNSAGTVDESNFDLGNLVYTDTVVTNQPPGTTTITQNGSVDPSVPLESCGFDVIVSPITNGNGYEGVANGVTVFTLTIDPATGQYVYTQFEPLDHPDTTNSNDVISIDFGINVESLDSSIVDSVITINIADDGPDAVQDINGAEEGQTITGNVVANDVLSQDDENTVTNVNFKGTDYPIPANGSETIVGDFGTLIINSDGTYEYTANSNDPDGVDTFTYTLTDCDGDTDTATLAITVTPDGQPVAVNQTLAVDETNLTPGPMIFNGDLNVDFGLDGAGTVTPNGQFNAGGSLLGGTLTSGGVPVVVTPSGNTYTGMAGTVTVFTVTINNNGTYEFQLFDHIDHADNTDPNDVITMEFGITATDADGDVVDGTFTINVHDDAPVAYDDGQTAVIESQSVNGNVLTGVGGPGATADELSEDRPTDVVLIGLSDTTGAILPGSEVSVPASGTATINGQFGVLVIAADGSYTYTANGNNANGIDKFTYVIEDFDGDRDTAEFSFNVAPENDVPIVAQPDPLTVDDTDLENGPNVVTGTVTVDYGNDGPGEVNPNDIFTSSVQNLTACGEPIVVTLSGNTYTGVADGMTIFTMEILENGDYTFTQLEAIDHPDTLNPNDSITLNFGARATDDDGDSTATTIQINVLDDGPQIDEIFHPVYEEVLENGTLVSTGNVPNDFGEDGAGSITLNGLFEAKFQMNGANVQLQSAGQDITVTDAGNVYTGRLPGGEVAFTLTVDPATGDYTYEQFLPIDHPDTTDPDDVIWLKFYVDITDCDGDMDPGIIIIDVHDDGPVAVDDDRSTEEGQTITGNVINNDDVGVDVEGKITQVSFNGTPTSVPETGTVSITGTHGVLTIAATGVYTYVANANATGIDQFIYTLQDGDGDTDEATLEITIAPDPSPININGSGSTDDTVVDNSGIDVETGTINVNYQGDGPGTTTGNGDFSSSGNRTNNVLSHNGVNIITTYDSTTGIYTGRAGSVTVFTMEINQNGTYRFEQLQNLDHSNTNSSNESITLNFGVTATDSDGDTGNGTVTITVRDDAPDAVNDSRTLSQSATSVTGNVLSNDDFGADDGSNARLLTNGTFNGTYGTLVLNQNGSYTYTRNGDNGGVDTFTYEIRDHDGDTDTATLTITVPTINDNNPININGSGSTDDTVVDNSGIDVETGTINVDYQGDGPGTTTVNGAFSSSGNRTGGTLSHNGTDINVTFNSTDNTYIGRAGNIAVFRMTINSNGTYKFEQFENLDHSDTGNANESITLNFGVRATDADGDTGNGVVTITVRDDAPTSVNDGTRSLNSGSTLTGNVLTNDDLGADGGRITDIWSNGTFYTVPATGSTTISLGNGTLTISSNGNYSYTSSVAGSEGFAYQVTDGDGDTSSATLAFTTIADDDKSPININGSGSTDDTIVDNSGIDVETGTINVDYQGDGPGTTTVNGAFSSSGNRTGGTLSHNGTDINVTFNSTDNTYIGRAGNIAVFRMTINSNGTYRFEQFENIDHSNMLQNNESITLNFGVRATDSDGDTGDGTVTITVRDDGPNAVNDSRTMSQNATSLLGNILANDDFGGDDGSSARLLTVGTYNGNYGTLTINQNGSYTYTRNGDNGGVDTFNYTIRDHDGDTDQATLSITVPQKDTQPPPEPPVEPPLEDKTPDIQEMSAKVYTDDTDVDNNGIDTVSSRINIISQGDGPATVSANGGFRYDGYHEGSLSSNGVNISVTRSGNTYFGKAGSVTVFKLVVQSNGDFTFTQYKNLDHSFDTFNDEGIELFFGVTLRDIDGDTDDGEIWIQVRDDGPNAVNDTNNVGTRGIGSGDVLDNDDFGADDGSGARVTTTGTFFGTHGRLILDDDGDYTYVRFTNNTSAGTDTFNYTIRDREGDIDSATLTINLSERSGDGDGGGGDGGGGDGFGGCNGDPLVFDLDGDGVELTTKADGVMFDLDLDGEKDQTSWVAPDDGLLAIDKNDDGIINDTSELFGDSDGFSDGFENLASYDSNNDGVIDAKDDVYDDLIMWQDLNSDGVSDANEMLTLEQVGIVSISLNADLPKDTFIEGNWISHVSSYTTIDGVQRDVVDAWFDFDSSAGIDPIIGSANADAFIFNAIQESSVEIMNFNTAEDSVDLSNLIETGDDIGEAINDFVYVSEQDGDTVISVDVDGANGPAEAVEVAKLRDVNGQSLEEMIDNGNIVI